MMLHRQIEELKKTTATLEASLAAACAERDRLRVQIDERNKISAAREASLAEASAEVAKLREVNAELLAALKASVDSHYSTWMAARAEVEGAAMSDHLFEKEPDVIAARAAIAKAESASCFPPPSQEPGND